MDETQQDGLKKVSRNEAIAAWQEKVEREKKTAAQIVEELEEGGAKTISPQKTIGEAWGPIKLETDKRQMIGFTKFSGALGFRFGKEILRAGLLHAVPNEEDKTLIKVPYLRFTDNGSVDPERSRIIMLPAPWVEDLNKLVLTAEE